MCVTLILGVIFFEAGCWFGSVLLWTLKSHVQVSVYFHSGFSDMSISSGTVQGTTLSLTHPITVNYNSHATKSGFPLTSILLVTRPVCGDPKVCSTEQKLTPIHRASAVTSVHTIAGKDLHTHVPEDNSVPVLFREELHRFNMQTQYFSGLPEHVDTILFWSRS